MFLAIVLFLSGLAYASCDMVDASNQSIECGVRIGMDYTAVGYKLCHDNGEDYVITCNNILAPEIPSFDISTFSGTCESGGYCPPNSSIGEVSSSASSPSSNSGGSSPQEPDFVSCWIQDACCDNGGYSTYGDNGTKTYSCWTDENNYYRDVYLAERNVFQCANPPANNCSDNSSGSSAGSSSGSGGGSSSASDDDGGGDATLAMQEQILSTLNSHDAHLSQAEIEFRDYFEQILAGQDLGEVLDAISAHDEKLESLNNDMTDGFSDLSLSLEYQLDYMEELNNTVGVLRAELLTAGQNSDMSLHGHMSGISGQMTSQINWLSEDLRTAISESQTNLENKIDGLANNMNSQFSGVHSHLGGIDANLGAIRGIVEETKVIATDTKEILISHGVQTTAQYGNVMSAIAGLNNVEGSSGSDGGASSGSLFDCAGNFYFPRVCTDPTSFESPAEYAHCCTGSSSGSDGGISSGSGGGSSGSRDCSGDMAEDPDCIAVAELKTLNSQFAVSSGALAGVQARISSITEGDLEYSSASSFGFSSAFLTDFQTKVKASQTGKFITDNMENWSLASGSPSWTFDALGHTYTIDLGQYKVGGKTALEWLGVMFKIMAILTSIFIIFG